MVLTENPPVHSGLQRDLVEAMGQIAETRHSTFPQYPSIGCSITWRRH